MTNFEQNGFLADIDPEHSKILHTKCGKHIELCCEANRLSQSYLFKLPIRNNDRTQILSGALFSRCLEHNQAALILSFRGLRSQVDILLRSLFEAMFPLVAIARDEGFEEEFVLSAELERAKAIRKHIDYLNSIDSNEKEIESFQTLLSTVVENNKEKKIRKISAYEAAERAGMLDWYNVLYTITSGAVHTSARELEGNLGIVEGNVKAISFAPNFKGLEDVYLASIESMLICVGAVIEIYDLPEDTIKDKLSARVRTLHDANA